MMGSDGRRRLDRHGGRSAAGRDRRRLAAIAIGGTIVANMTVKIGVTLAYARGKGLSAALALVASMAALAVGLVVGWLRL